MESNPVVVSAVLASVLLIAGCESAEEKPAKDCFPADAYRWMAKSGQGNVGKDKIRIASDATRATVYVDRSGSMAGYISGATNLERPFQDLISTLPATLRLADLETEVRSFGKQVSEPLANQGAVLQDAKGFRCNRGDPASCDNDETHLDKVFARAAQQSGELSIVLSDLWFTNSEVNSSGLAALQPLLTEILISGRVVAVYGIDSPFAGKIFDLPRAGTGLVSTPYSGRHPLYMVVVGSKSDVDAFHKLLPKSGSRFIADGLDTGKIERSLFAVDPGPESELSKAPLSKGSHPRLMTDPFSIPLGVSVQRYSMSAGLPELSAKKQKRQLPSWTGPSDDYFLQDAVWKGDVAARTRVWVQINDKCEKGSWAEQGQSDLGWSEGAEGQRTFRFDPDMFGATLAREGTYIVTGEIQRESLEQPNPDTGWLRGPWNLDPAKAEGMQGASPKVFPTLNLSEFGRIMEGALAEAAQRKKQPIAGFMFMVRVKD